MIAGNDEFRFKQHSLLCQAYMLRIPYTVHVAIGTDIIHQHPLCDFAAIGKASGQDFKIFIHSVTQMDGGVFCNFGSSVIGPEVFLKSLSIARNLGNPLRNITTANFDLVPLKGDYRQPAGKDQPEYYYRPKKNIVIRPNSLGGRGFHINGDHRQTIPNLYHLIRNQLGEGSTLLPGEGTRKEDNGTTSLEGDFPSDLFLRSYLAGWIKRYPELEPSSLQILKAIRMLVNCFRVGGTLYLCGNGGSFADALHIGAELNKSFKHPRLLPSALRERLLEQPGGEMLAGTLQQGLRSIVLGTNPSLLSAIDNDTPHRHLYFAQELISLARPGDVILGISTSGKAENIRLALKASQARGVKSIVLTGPVGSPLRKMADVAISSPGQDTATIQEWHIRIYHAMCEVLEQIFFGESGEK
jgi:phosphoheptose isomerase